MLICVSTKTYSRAIISLIKSQTLRLNHVFLYLRTVAPVVWDSLFDQTENSHISKPILS